LPHDVLLDGGDNTGTPFKGHHPVKIQEGKKHSKIGAIYDNFRARLQISLERIEIKG